MAIINTKPDMNSGLWAESGNIEIPSDTKISEGWALEKPLNEYMNWVQNRQDTMLQYLNQRGIGEWDSRTDYPMNAYVARGGSVYKAMTQNTDKDPVSNPTIWFLAFATYEEYFNLFNDVENIKTTEGFLDLYVSKNNPIMTGDAKGTAYLDSHGESGLDLNSDTPVIKKDGEVVVEFSGGLNPKDVVTHEQLNEHLQFYKVGDIYITTNNTNPETSLGYGSWQLYGQGKVLVGRSESLNDPNWTKVTGTTFGEYDHKLTTQELPSHYHSKSPYNKFGSRSTESGKGNPGSIDYGAADNEYGVGTMGSEDWVNATEGGAGGDQSHNNVQPSIVVNMWLRTS